MLIVGFMVLICVVTCQGSRALKSICPLYVSCWWNVFPTGSLMQAGGGLLLNPVCYYT